jgi:hypothetical protein
MNIGLTMPFHNNFKKEIGLSFDGVDDYIDISSYISDRLNGASGITFTTKIRCNGIAKNNAIFGMRINTAAAGMDVSIQSDSTIKVAGRSQATDSYQQVSNAFNQYNQMIHLAAIFDFQNSLIKIYINGTMVKSQSVAFGSKTYIKGSPTQKDTIGITPALSDSFTGDILHSRIYNRILSDAEVNNNYKGVITRNGLICEWLFDEKGGTNVYDTFNLNNGIIHGPVWKEY